MFSHTLTYPLKKSSSTRSAAVPTLRKFYAFFEGSRLVVLRFDAEFSPRLGLPEARGFSARDHVKIKNFL
jgi:hypothetical protein